MRHTNKILYGQTMLDLAIQETGDIERLFELAVDNDLEITADLEVGSQLIVGEVDRSKRTITQLFKDRARRPASGDPDNEVISNLAGIDYWAIGVDFIVQ